MSSPSATFSSQTLGTLNGIGISHGIDTSLGIGISPGIDTSHGIGTSHSSARRDSSSPLIVSETFVDDAPDDSDSSSAVFYAHDNSAEDDEDVDDDDDGQQNEQQQQQQNAKNKQKAKFECTKCNTNFKSDEMLELHQNNCRLTTLSRKLSSKCDICNNIFATRRGMLIHKHKKHGASKRGRSCADNTLFSCSTCDYHAKNASTLKKHQSIHKRNTTTNHSQPCSVDALPPSVIDQQSARPLDHRRNTKAKSTLSNTNVQPTKKLQCRASLNPSGRPMQIGYGGSALERGGQTMNVHEGSSQNITTTVKIDEENDDDDILIIEASESKHTNALRNKFANVGQQQNGAAAVVACSSSADISNYAGMVISACAQSNLVTFHDVKTVQGTIGKITFQFTCNNCRGQRGIARCFRGRAYCVMCCGHPECD
ncbi:hypothetical protein niasHS_008480 [Heterodera schachtii]|uniref:C2H2-type domain-containing protein n=1 Tax=Heterodera schachtii TaxID=97005 RepID=A0ABD2J614_HETSC